MHHELPHRVLIVAPHLDDAVFSCWALIARPGGADVLTVFAGSPAPPRQGEWDRICGFASSAESIPARRREEERALGDRAGRLRLLDLHELQYVQPPRPLAEAARIVEAVEEWRGEDDGSIAVPAGAGWRPGRLRRAMEPLRLGRFSPPPGPTPHPDHLFVRDALIGYRPLILYEELPYVWGGPADAEVARVAEQRGRTADAIALPVDREEKAKRLTSYESQLPHVSPPGRRMDDPVALPPVERYWLLTA